MRLFFCGTTTTIKNQADFLYMLTLLMMLCLRTAVLCTQSKIKTCLEFEFVGGIITTLGLSCKSKLTTVKAKIGRESAAPTHASLRVSPPFGAATAQVWGRSLIGVEGLH